MSNANSFQQPFRFRLNCIDHYQAAPTHLDPQLASGTDASGADAPAVPIIRVFGATETGQKVCAHIHGAFPYLYLEYKGGLEADDGTSPKGLDSCDLFILTVAGI
jgi:DNA polymerase zeta